MRRSNKAHATYMRAYYWRPKVHGKWIKRLARYRSTHRKELAAAARAYYRKHRKEQLARMKRYAAKHRNQIGAYKRNWAKENRARLRLVKAKWRKRNPDKVSAIHRIDNTRRRAKGNGTFTHEQWLELCGRHEWRCALCHRRRKLEVDHIVALSKNGHNRISNIQPLCRSCNARKSASHHNHISASSRG